MSDNYPIDSSILDEFFKKEVIAEEDSFSIFRKDSSCVQIVERSETRTIREEQRLVRDYIKIICDG